MVHKVNDNENKDAHNKGIFPTLIHRTLYNTLIFSGLASDFIVDTDLDSAGRPLVQVRAVGVNISAPVMVYRSHTGGELVTRLRGEKRLGCLDRVMIAKSNSPTDYDRVHDEENFKIKR